jgi:phage shock protein A
MTDSPSTPSEPIDAEIVPPVTPTPDYDERGVPSLDYVRDKIEGRYATAMGDTELTEGSSEARSLDEQQAQREKAAKAKLDEIRRTLGN